MNPDDNPFQSPRMPLTAPSAGDPDFDYVLWEIKKQSRNGIVMAIAGVVLCMPYLLSPIAIYSGKRALRMIDEHNRGREFERTARRAIQWGYLPLALFVMLFVGAFVFALIANAFQVDFSL